MIKHGAIALALAGVLGIGAASAGPLPTGIATVKDAASGHVTDVRWRGRHIGPGLAFGLAAGALVGAAVAARPYGPGYGYYEEPAYAAPYGYEPAPVYGYGYPPPTYSYGSGYLRSGGCVSDEGYGRRTAC